MSGPEKTFTPEQKSKIQPVNDRLKSIPHDAVLPRLEKRLSEATAIDPKAGIVIAPLKDIEAVKSEGQMYDYYAARILQDSHVNAHYHLHGEEPYHILSGEGEMYLGIVKDNKVEWCKQPQKVKSGDLIEVKEGEVHSLRNKRKEPLDFTFACPKEHLTEEDRFFTEGLIDGAPPLYRSKL